MGVCQIFSSLFLFPIPLSISILGKQVKINEKKMNKIKSVA